MPFATTVLPHLKIALGAGESSAFDTGLPVLAGDQWEKLFGDALPAGLRGALVLFQTKGWLLGATTVPLTSGLEDTSHRLYRNILEATRGHHLARIWNYVPAINEPGPAGLENYRLFCRGRSLAFEQHHGHGFKALLPSASAVGNRSAALTVAFAASTSQPRHVENPLQTAAYDYPDDYGPRAPSFARATVVAGTDRATVFISGTAAIRGYATVAPHHTLQQLECTLDNLREISGSCGLGPDLDQNGDSTRHFKVYLRHATDQPVVAALLEEKLLKSTDHVCYLQADICRSPLLVEIEASLFDVTSLRV